VHERRLKISWMVVVNDGFAWMVRLSVDELELDVGLSLPQAARPMVTRRVSARRRYDFAWNPQAETPMTREAA
jgi:hypothetical protein